MKYLKRSGLKILAQNYRCQAGEIDIIALDCSGAQTICFVEVKTRSGDEFVKPISAVGKAKRRQIRRAGQYYLAQNADDNIDARCDVITLVIRSGLKPQLEHTQNAFT